MKNILVFFPLMLAVAGCASTTDKAETDKSAARTKVPEAVVEGEAVDCIQLSHIRDSRVHSNNVIDFHMNNGQVYRNTLPNACPQLGFEEAFSYKTSLSKLCSVDIITVIRKGGGPMQGASCGLGTFQPVKLKPKNQASS